MEQNELSKVVLVHAMKAFGGMDVWLKSFLIQALNGSQLSASHPSSLKSVISNRIHGQRLQTETNVIRTVRQ
jgi:hypothetical protein